MTWIQYIVQAFKNLGGLATYTDLYGELERIRPESFTTEWKATVRRTVETHSSHSANYIPGKPNLFYSVAGIGKGVWALRNYEQLEVATSDVAEPLTTYSTQLVTRVIRDSILAYELKRLYQFRCQICEARIALTNYKFYAEGHHIKPLGGPHYGPDLASNMLVVCPNHHVELDFGVREINVHNLLIVKHTIQSQYIEYHNQNIYPHR